MSMRTKIYPSDLVLFLCLCHTLLLTQRISAKLISCEGFIQSDIQIDLSRVQTKLFTAQGNLKHETECNPQNGYFLIPVYNKGKYLVKVSAPDGWIFVPEFHEIEISENGGCSDELNFRLFGFKVRGIVLNGQNSPLVLGLYTESGNLVEETKTDSSGKYSFITKPGKYAISPIAGSVQCMDQGSINFEVSNSPVHVKPDIRIAGHNLGVRVEDESGNPIPRATVVLFSDRQIKFENLPINAGHPIATNIGTQWLYSLDTDDSGIALFHCLSVGKYRIGAKLQRANSAVLFDEKNIEMDTKAKKVVISIKSFNFSGKVTTSKSNAIPEVKIFFDGIEKTKSDANGHFFLDNIAPGRHVLEAKKEHWEFQQITVTMSSNTATDKIVFVPSRMAICASVLPPEKLDFIVFELINLVKEKIVAKLHPDAHGKFCTLVEPAKYILKPVSSIAITPKEKEIDLTEKPCSDIKFLQYKARIEGNVECFKECKNIRLELWQGTQMISQKNVPLDGKFGFDDLPPTKYKLKIKDQQNIWWTVADVDVEIKDKDVRGIKFTQKGYSLNVQTTHPAMIKYWPDGKPANSKTAELSEGANWIHFSEAAKFSFSIDSCYQFGIDGADQNQFVLPSIGPIVLTAVSSSISVLVHSADANPPLNLILREKLSGGESPPQKVDVKDGNHIKFTFNLSHFKIGGEFVVIPKSDRLLFSPDEYSFIFDGNCNERIVSFESQVGRFIQGSVSPIVSGAVVKATHRSKPEIVLTSQTDESGTYKIGPLWNVEDYTVEMSSPFYIIDAKPGNSHNFASIKLSQLSIQFVDVATKSPLADVLVSISGGSNFRSNNVTDTSGILNFIGLAPGPYYIRPILQEYKFNSSSFTVHIVEGQTQELILEAKRFAYSAFGKVSTIGSKPHRKPIRIEAVSALCENHQEEDLLDGKTDEFRIRGLQPKCLYRISLKDVEDREIRAFPPLITLMTGEEDKTGVNFVLLPSEQPSPVVMGELEISGGSIPPSGFRVVLSMGGNIVQELIHSSSSVFFFNLPAYHKEYKVSVDRIETKQLRTDPVSASFVASFPFNYIRLIPKAGQRTRDVEVLKANYFGLALIAMLTLAFMNQSKTRSLLEYLLAMGRTFIDRRQEWPTLGTIDESKRKKAKKL